MKPGGYYPTDNVVQSGGTCLGIIEPLAQLGTLGPRVDRAANPKFYYVATYHNFDLPPFTKNYMWEYGDPDNPTPGQTGSVIQQVYLRGADGLNAKLDCALIRLDDATPSAVRPGVLNTTTRVAGTSDVVINTLVMKYGVITGLTYGIVTPLPTAYTPEYDGWLFAIEHTDERGFPLSGPFCEAGDSGASVLVKRGNAYFIAGLLIVSGAPGEEPRSIACRIGRIESYFNIKVHRDP